MSNSIHSPDLFHGMPPGFPYPDAPTYDPGQYGEWSIHAKPDETVERGYFTDFETEPAGYYLMKDGHIWMSDSRLERESHAVHLKDASGVVVVCGVGMGMYLFNVAAKASVTQVIAIDRDRSVMDLAQHAGRLEDWPGHQKIRFVHKDVLQLSATDIGAGQVDYLYVDIWPELGDSEAIRHTQAIQAVVQARSVGWWGQEVDFIQWLFESRPAGHVPTLEDYNAFVEAVKLPMAPQSADYVLGCRRAGEVISGYGSQPFAVEARSRKAAGAPPAFQSIAR